MGVLFGLVAALCWGAGDYLITLLARGIGTPRAMLWIQVFSLLFWAFLLLLFGLPGHATSRDWALALGCGVFHVLGLVFTYRAFEVGTLSIVSPIASGFAIVTAVLGLATGERPALSALLGVVLLVVGVVVVTHAQEDGHERSLAGVPAAIASAIAFGIMFWMFDYLTPHLGYAQPLVVLKVMATGSAVYSVWRAGASTEPSLPFGRLVPLAIGAALLDTLAWLGFIFGIRTAYTSIVTAVASLFSAFTVFLAWILLRERLHARQMVGVGSILLGVLLVSLFGGSVH